MKRLRVLVIDDDKDCAFLVGELIDNHIIVDKAYSYKDALDKSRLNHYDLVITDVELGDGNGIDLIREIRKSTLARRFFVMSGSCVDVPIAVRDELGIIGCVEKPFDLTEFRLLLRSILNSISEGLFTTSSYCSANTII